MIAVNKNDALSLLASTSLSFADDKAASAEWVSEDVHKLLDQPTESLSLSSTLTVDVGLYAFEIDLAKQLGDTWLLRHG